MGDFDCVDSGRIERPADVPNVVESVLMADGVHAIAQRHVLNVEIGVVHAGTPVAICSAVLIAADVMMSRLPAYGGQIVARSLDLEEDRHLPSGELAVHLRDAHGGRSVEDLELDLLLEPVAGYVLLHGLDHLGDRGLDRLRLTFFDQTEDGVAHDQRRLGGIEHDDRLAPLGAADHLDRPRRWFR